MLGGALPVFKRGLYTNVISDQYFIDPTSNSCDGRAGVFSSMGWCSSQTQNQSLMMPRLSQNGVAVACPLLRRRGGCRPVRPRAIQGVPGLDPNGTPFERFRQFASNIARISKTEADTVIELPARAGKKPSPKKRARKTQ